MMSVFGEDECVGGGGGGGGGGWDESGGGEGGVCAGEVTRDPPQRC